MTCTKCAQEVAATAAFCRRCGTKVTPLEGKTMLTPSAPALRPPDGPPPVLPPPGPPPNLGVPSAPQRSSGLRWAGLGLVGVAVIAGTFWVVPTGSRQDIDDTGLFASMAIAGNTVRLGIVNSSGQTLFEQSIQVVKGSSAGWAPRNVGDLFQVTDDWGALFGNEANQRMIVDRFGKKTIDPPAIPIDDFTEGLAPAKAKDGKCGYLDRNHALAVPAVYDKCFQFSSGLALVRTGGKYGYVDKSGKLQLPAIYRDATAFRDGRAMVETESGNLVIDPKGREILRVKSGLNLYYGGLLSAKVKYNGLLGFFDVNGKAVIPEKFESAWTFDSHRTFVREPSGEWQMIDDSGEVIPTPALQSVKAAFWKGLAQVQVSGKWGLINTSGKMIVEARFDKIERPNSGLREATIGQETVFLDETGAVVKAPRKYCPAYNHRVFTCLSGLPNEAFAAGNGLGLGILLKDPSQIEKVTIEHINREGNVIAKIAMADLKRIGELVKGAK